jgi:predicted nucleic acid-binding protein
MALLRATYLADKSALARMPHPSVRRRLRDLLEDGVVATCAIVDLELLYSARSPDDYEAILEERRALDEVPITPQVTSRAIDVQHELARTSQHRIPIPDLLIAAAAESAALTILHYDADYERIAAVTAQPHEWIAPRGSL